MKDKTKKCCPCVAAAVQVKDPYEGMTSLRYQRMIAEASNVNQELKQLYADLASVRAAFERMAGRIEVIRNGQARVTLRMVGCDPDPE